MMFTSVKQTTEKVYAQFPPRYFHYFEVWPFLSLFLDSEKQNNA